MIYTVESSLFLEIKCSCISGLLLATYFYQNNELRIVLQQTSYSRNTPTPHPHPRIRKRIDNPRTLALTNKNDFTCKKMSYQRQVVHI